MLLPASIQGKLAPQPETAIESHDFEVEDFHTYFVGESGVWVHNTGQACERLFSLYDRFRRINNKPPEESWRLIEKLHVGHLDNAGNFVRGQKVGAYSDVALGNALEDALRKDVFGDDVLKLWTKGPRDSPGHNMFMHYKQHVLENKSGIPGGEFPNIKNAMDYVKEARVFIQSQANDVVTWTQNGNKLVFHKTDARFAVQVVNTGEMRTFFRANPQNGTLLDWARQRGYTGPAF